MTNTTQEPLFRFYAGSNYIALPRDPQPWLIEKLIPVGVTNLIGKPKKGKSFLALEVAIAISDPNTSQLLGHPVVKHGPVCYLQVDTPREEWATRAQRIRDNGYSIEGVHFTDAHLVPYPLDITLGMIKEALKATINEIKPLLLVVDTLREVHEGDENDSSDMKKVITALVEVTKETNTSLLLVSHTRKDSLSFNKGGEDDETLMDDGRGSSYVSGRMDMVIKLTDKSLLFKGRSVGKQKLSIEQDNIGMVTLNAEKAENEANIKYVLAQPQLTTIRQRAEMLAAMENIELEAARSRIRNYVKKNGLKEDI